MYTTDTNREIIEFFSRAQSKIGDISKRISSSVYKRKKVDAYYDDMVLAFHLDCFVKAIDNNYNTWSEDEIIQYMNYWDNKANLRSYPYVQRDRYNVNINFG